MTDVFISYSRKDTEFVRRLHEALAARGRDTWVDWEDIPLTAEWWGEIQEGIESADTFAFILSPDSARSKVCFDEVEHAHQNNKRIVPILHRDVTEEPDRERLHWTINRHNWVFMRPEDDFDKAFGNLIKAIDTDLEHVKTHTTLLIRARNWDRIGRQPSPLLRGTDLRDAEAWLTTIGDKDPKPTELHTAYVVASRQAANRFQRRILASVGVALIIMLGLTILSLFLFQNANTERQRADDNAATSQANFYAASTAEAFAQEQADRARSEALAAYSQTIEESDPELALMLALDANKIDPPSGNAWRQLARLAFSVPVRREMEGSGSFIEAVAFSPDDQLLAGVEMGGHATVWDTNTGETVAEFSTSGQGTSAVFSPDGRYLAVGTSVSSGVMRTVQEQQYDPTGFAIVVYELATQQEALRLLGHTGSVNAVDFSPDGQFLISGSGHRTIDDSFQDVTDPVRDLDEDEIILWDIETGEEVRRFEGHDGYVTGVKFLPDGDHFISAGFDGSLIEWDIETGDPTILGSFRLINDLALSADAQQILLTGAGLTLLDRTGQTLQTIAFNGQRGTVSPDGSRLFGAYLIGVNTLAEFDASSGEEIQQHDEHQGIVTAVAVSHNGRWLASGGVDGLAILRGLVTDERSLVLGKHDAGIWDAAFTPDGRYILSGGSDNRMLMWDVEESTLFHEFSGHTDWIDNVAISPDGTWAASTGREERIAVWDIDPASTTFGEALYWLDTDSFTRGLAFGDERTQLITLNSERGVTIWDVTTGERTAEWELSSSALDLDYRANRLAVLKALDVELYQLDPAAPDERSLLNTFTDSISSSGGTHGRLMLSQEGRHLAVAVGDFMAMTDSEQAAVGLIDLETGGVRSFVGVPATVWNIGISSDDSLLAAAYDETVIVWDTNSGVELQRIDGLGTQVKAVSFNPSGNLLTLATDDIGDPDEYANSVILLEILTPQELIEYVEQNFTLREYTCDERLTYGVGEPCD